MSVQRFLETDFMHRRPCAVTLSLRSVRRRPIVVIRRKSRAIPRPLALHLRDLRIRNLQSVLDRITSAVQRPLQTDPVVGVARHFPLPAVRLVYDRLQLFHRQRRLRNQVSLLVHPRPVRHVHLDPVRAVLQLLPRRLPRFHRPIHKLRAFGHFQFRRITFQVVSARRRYRPRRAENSRSGNRSLFYRLLDLYVAVSRALRLHIPQRGKTLLQRPPCRISSPRRPQRDSRFQNIRVVTAFRRVLTPQENMRVRIDQPRQNRRVRKINQRRPRRDLRRTVRHFFNPLPAHENELILPRRLAHPVDQHSRANHRQRRRRWRAALPNQNTSTHRQHCNHAQNSLPHPSPPQPG